MALINKESFQLIQKNTNLIHNLTNATYSIFTKDGLTIFQIDTIGTPERDCPGKVSQSLQIDKQVAEDLIVQLKKAFNLS